jgi:flagellar hook-associated protein 3 FlgL
MRVSSNSFTDQFVSQVSQLQQQEISLQGQASSGLAVSSPSDNPSVMSEVLNYQTQASENQGYQSNITDLQAAATTSGTAISSLQTISSEVETLAQQAVSGTNNVDFTTLAGQVGSYIQEALTAANTQDANGNYIFGGTNNSTPPFVATTNASGVVTGVTYQGNSSTAQVEIAPGTTATAQVPGANTTGSGATGLITDSSSGADFFNHLIQLQADLTAAATTKNTTAITSTDIPNLTKDNNHFIDQVSANGVLQSTLTTNQNLATSRNTSITTDISNKTSADLATTLTQLQQTETAYQAALESGSKIFQTSLLTYLQ